VPCLNLLDTRLAWVVLDMGSTNDQLKNVVWKTTWGGSFLTLIGTGLFWAGSQDFKTSNLPWLAGLAYILFLNVCLPVLYFAYRNQSPVWVNGVMGILGGLVPAAGVLGMGAHFFYFSLAPMPRWVSLFGLVGGTALILHWGYKIACDVMDALHSKGLLAQAYIDADKVYYCDTWSFMQKMDAVQLKRDPFKSYHLWLALAITPFAVVLNRFLTPYTGSGHGVFIVLSILGLPMSLWIIGVAVRAYIVMIHYPLKLQHKTGKPVLMREIQLGP